MPDLIRPATLMHDCAEFRCSAYGQATLILSGDVALETLPASTFSPPPVARWCFASACVDLSGSRPSRRLRLRWRLLSDPEPLDPARLGACLSSRWHFRSESDSVLLHEQAFPPLEDRPGAASAAERAGLRAEGPSVAFHRGAGPGEPGPG